MIFTDKRGRRIGSGEYENLQLCERDTDCLKLILINLPKRGCGRVHCLLYFGKFLFSTLDYHWRAAWIADGVCVFGKQPAVRLLRGLGCPRQKRAYAVRAAGEFRDFRVKADCGIKLRDGDVLQDVRARRRLNRVAFGNELRRRRI